MSAKTNGNQFWIRGTGSLSQRSTTRLNWMKTTRTTVALVALILTTGCVVFPTSHVVFEPISSQGTLTNPGACGYMFSNKILLVIETPDYRLETMTYADDPEKNLTVFFRIVPSASDIKIDFSSIRVVLGSGDGNEMKCASVTQHAYGRSGKDVQPVTGVETLIEGTRNFYLMEFPVTRQSIEEFTLIFGRGAIMMGDKLLNIDPVRFEKSRKGDIYFGSINC